MTKESTNTAYPYGDKRYYSLSDYCKETFGEKIYRLSLTSGMTCPNRDGKLSYGGCAFCSEGGSGDFAAPYAPIRDQLTSAKERIQGKTSCRRYIAYFQSFTNTYAPIERLRALFEETLAEEEVAVLSIGTRSDCISDEVVALLAELNRRKPIWAELGLQTIHQRTLDLMNTHTSVAQYDDAVARLHAAGIPVVCHIILGLPGETKEDMLQTVDYVAHTPTWGVKLQLLHVLRNTELARLYEANPFPLMEAEEYCRFVGTCIQHLRPDQVIHRLTGDGPKNLLIAPLWSADKKRVLNLMTRTFRELDIRQGQEFTWQNPSPYTS